jgi:hypothetical protein
MTFLAELLRPIGHLIFKVAVLFALLFARVITAAFFLLFIVPVLSISWAYSFFQISKTHSNDTDYEQDKTVEGIQGVHGVRITICRTDEVSDFELDCDTVRRESGEWEGRGSRRDDILMGQESESRAREWVDGVTHDA